MKKDEKLLFLEEVKRLRLLSSFEDKMNQAFYIYKMFISADSPLEINISSDVRKNIQRDLDDIYMSDIPVSINVFSRIFKAAERSVMEDAAVHLFGTMYRSESDLSSVIKRRSQRASPAGDLLSSVPSLLATYESNVQSV